MNMSNLVRSGANILMPFILVYGFYIVVHGHLTPGGGFQGGAVIATAVVLLMVAYSYENVRASVSKHVLKNSETAGLLLFIGTALLALTAGLAFFGNWLLDAGTIFATPVAFGINPGDINTGGIIPVLNIAVGIEVLGAMGLLLLAMLGGLKGDAE
ncbi:MnhB domain-containing protein [Methanogenium organophilum]|uniref:Sodium:proton antiporter n=1 Tax=Methanogenium organophilum TaxID=2199 RepID=A0A9X9S4A0_METOG|nr:MnhB domain-containing protein [Methanogenium organophilum]WAI01472.1 sodium:proton antiporter [Methanogenium organophilum]